MAVPEIARAAQQVSLVLAPVSATLHGSSEVAVTLVEETVAAGDGRVVRMVSVQLIGLCLNAPAVVPHVPQLLADFPMAAAGRFDATAVEVGATALRAGLVSGRSPMVAQLLDAAAADMGELITAQGAVAAAWWSLLCAARLADRDPLSVARQVGLSVASLSV